MSSAVNRVMALAVVGRIVRYVMESGAVRPMIVVNDFGSGTTVSGVVFLDIANDPPGEAHDGSGVKLPLMSVSSVPYNFDKAAGSWHWPNLAQKVEGEAAVTSEHVQQMFSNFRDNINAKLEAHLEAVGKIADGVSGEFHSALAKLHAPPVSIGGADTQPSAADLDAVAAEQQAANATANAAVDDTVAMQEPGAEVGSGG